MRKNAIITILVAMVIFSFFLGYVIDAGNKADRLYDLKTPKIIYRDTCCCKALQDYNKK